MLIFTNQNVTLTKYYRNLAKKFNTREFKNIYYCQIEIIKGLTDKGQFQQQIIGASRGDLPVYNTISFTKIKINILS